MQIYADILNRPIKTSRSAQTCALGSAIAASVAAGAHEDMLTAVQAMTGTKEKVYLPTVESNKTYENLYKIYTLLHDSFGVSGTQNDLSHVMKQLIQIHKDAVK